MVKLPFSGSVLFFVFMLTFQTATATDTAHCAPSPCGITNISYPFRLPTDPIGCGDGEYNLSCEHNVIVLHLHGGKYYVQAINYDNFTIRLVDASVDKDDCSSIPGFSLTSDSFHFRDPYALKKCKQESGDELTWEKLSTEMIGFIKCRNPVYSSVYLDTSPCINSSTNSLVSHSETYTYAYVGEAKGYDLLDSCSLERVSLLPRRDSTNRMSSFIEIHREMAFGFELSWHNINCRNCSSRRCYLDREHHFQCSIYNSEYAGFQMVSYNILGITGPKMVLGTIVWVWETTIVYICIILAARALCGTPCVAALLIYKWRRRHLLGHNTTEEDKQTQNNLMPVQMHPSDRPQMNQVEEIDA